MQFRVVCCESQDISCGMRKIENWSDQFGIEIALGPGIFAATSGLNLQSTIRTEFEFVR